MAHQATIMNNYSGHLRFTYVGFSWTTLFFGCFVPLWRADFIGFILMIFSAFATAGISMLIWPFFYNRFYNGRLLTKGYRLI